MSGATSHYFVVRLVLFISAVLAAQALALLCLGRDGAKAEYVGGTIPELHASSGGLLITTHEQAFIFVTGKRHVQVPYERVNLLEYGQKVDRRLAEAVIFSPLFLLSKKRKHFLTVGFTDETSRQQAMVFKVEKGQIRTVLVVLEARTGRKVQFQDEEARKAGKG